jgi:Fe-S cluster biosynthesis and repair protein YggX
MKQTMTIMKEETRLHIMNCRLKANSAERLENYLFLFASVVVSIVIFLIFSI